MPEPPSAAELLSPGGSVARLLPHYEARLEQQQMAELVDRALGENKLAVIEAGPGTGKSFGYLFALLLHALRTGTAAVVSSSTHVLQDQLIQRDIPFTQRVLEEHGIEFRAAEVKGMGAYLCRLALAETSGALIVDFPDAVGKLERWAEQAREGTRSEAPAVPPEVWEQVRAERDTCTRDRCRFYDSCFFFNARRRAAQAHLLVANHSLVFADLAIKEEGGRVLPHYTVLVLDEAHNVEDAATRFLGLEISLSGLKMLLHRLYDGRGRGALPGLEQAVPDFRRLPAGKRHALPDFLQRQVYPEVGNAEAALENAFRGIERAYHELVPNPEHAREIPKPLRLTPRIYEHGALVHAQVATHHMAATLELVANRVGAIPSPSGTRRGPSEQPRFYHRALGLPIPPRTRPGHQGLFRTHQWSGRTCEVDPAGYYEERRLSPQAGLGTARFGAAPGTAPVQETRCLPPDQRHSGCRPPV